MTTERELNILFSFADRRFALHLSKLFAACEDACALNVFLDSGAYSKANSEKQVSLEEYAEFLQENKDLFYGYITMDEIGDPEQSWKNTEYLEQEGLDPWPVFHYGSPIYVLDSIVDRYEKIALGGPGGTHIHLHQTWADMCISYIRSRKPDMRVHGLGVSHSRAAESFLYNSLDSTTWVKARLGSMNLFHPLHNRLYTFARGDIGRNESRYALMMETMEFYGINPIDFLAGVNTAPYRWAGFKAFVTYGRYLNTISEGFVRLFLAGVDPLMLEKAGFFDYVFHDNTQGASVMPLPFSGKGATN